MNQTATCLCGQLSLVYTGEITKSSLCHCYDCQKRTGSIFGSQVLLAKDKLTIAGETKIYTHMSDEDNPVQFYSCPICASTVYWQVTAFPEHLAVAVGCFANQDFAAPTFSVYEDRMHKWLLLPETITEHLG